MRQLIGPPRCFAEPERNRRRLAACIFDAYETAFDPDDAIRGVAELEDVAGETFDCEIFVDGADELTLGLEHHLVVGGVWNRTAGRDRGQACPLASAQKMVDCIVIDQCTLAAAARREAFGEHAHDFIERLARQRSIGMSTPHQIEQLLFATFARGRFSNDVLSEDVDRVLGNLQTIELAAAHCIQ